jgi:hypothetical protein
LVFADRLLNHSYHCVQAPQHFVIRKAQDTEPLCFKITFPRLVLFLLPKVHWAINLYDQPGLDADKISDERSDTMLTPKPDTSNLAPAQHLPQSGFGWRWLMAHLSCARFQSVPVVGRTVVPILGNIVMNGHPSLRYVTQPNTVHRSMRNPPHPEPCATHLTPNPAGSACARADTLVRPLRGVARGQRHGNADWFHPLSAPERGPGGEVGLPLRTGEGAGG